MCPLPFLPYCSGRLFNQIRSREGLAYAVSGGWRSTPIDHPGLFVASAETARPAALLAALRGALEAAAAVEPPAEEVQRAQQARRAAAGRQAGSAALAQPGLPRLTACSLGLAPRFLEICRCSA
jgi:predicted Zn-dependent peptidase